MRAVIAEDSVLLRIGLVKVLEMAGFEVVAETGDAEGLLAAVEEHRPELALVDVRMPPGFTDEGVRAALMIRQESPGTAVLLLSQYVEERYAADLLATQTRAASATCSNNGSPTWRSSSTPCAASPRAAPHWTRRSSPNSCCAAVAARTPWAGSLRASARSSP